jgi:hypothetical protein
MTALIYEQFNPLHWFLLSELEPFIAIFNLSNSYRQLPITKGAFDSKLDEFFALRNNDGDTNHD